MTDDNSDKLVDIDNLEDFETDFFGEAKDEVVEEVEEVEDTDDDAVATDEDTDAEADAEDDAEDSEEDSDEDSDPDEDEEEEEEPKPKGKNRKSFQNRINEITRRAKEAEREAAALLKRLEQLEARERDATKNEAPIQEKLAPGAPAPDALNEKGELIYPLGEFDPNFIRDLAQFTVQEKMKEAEAERERAYREQMIQQEKQALTEAWAEKLEAAEEENPEIRDHILDLTDSFADLDPAYGEYLALTIMQSENGPQVLEYLSQNIGEAQKIVASGPAAATLAIGRIDARVGRSKDENRNPKRMSKAPPPPTGLNRGRKGSGDVRPDTDNLDAFERLYYGKK